MNAVGAWWERRSEAERRTLRLAAAALAAIVLAVAWLEIERARVRLHAELPRLRASIAGLERDAAEVKRLRGVAPLATAGSGQTGAAPPLAALATDGGGLAGAQITILDAKRVKLEGPDISFGALLEWLQNAQATHAMRVEGAHLEALPATGRVRAELLLTRS